MKYNKLLMLLYYTMILFTNGCTEMPPIDYFGVTPPSRDASIAIARSTYALSYPDAKPVEYVGQTGDATRKGFWGGTLPRMAGADLTAFYKDAKNNEDKLVSDDNYTYLFSFYDGDRILASMQIDAKNFNSIKSLIQQKKGIMEPILYLDEHFKIKVDVKNTKKIYKQLSKMLSLKPIDVTMRLGDLLVERIERETNYRMRLSEERVKALAEKELKISLFEGIAYIKEVSTVETEYQTIYNTRFKEIFNSQLFDNVGYIVLLNRDNMFIDRFPNFVTQKIASGEYIRLRGPQVEHTSGKQELLQIYVTYKASVESGIDTLKEGNNYANTSIQIFSLDRFRTLENTGTKLIPDIKVTATNIDRLDDFLLTSQNGNTKYVEYITQCFSGPTETKKCWKEALDNWEHLWDSLMEDEVKSQITRSRTLAMNQYDYVILHLMKAKDKLKISGFISSKKLK